MGIEAGQSVRTDRNRRFVKLSQRLFEAASGLQSAIRNPQSAIPIAAFLVITVSAIIGGLFADPAVPTKPSNEMADNPAVRDFVKAIQSIEDNYAITPDKERLTQGAVLGMLH